MIVFGINVCHEVWHEAKQEEICARIEKEGLSVRDTEKLVKAGDTPKKKRRKSKKDPDIIAVEERLKEIYGTKVSITTNGRKGAVEFSYYGREDLNRLIEALEAEK